MTRIIDLFVATFMLLTWFIGIVLAKGWGSTILSVIFPPWAWYLVVEWAVHRWML